MFIGEALGEVEANEGRPFRGGTGKMLRMMIYQSGLTPDQYYITNTIKCRPPANRTPTKPEISYCSQAYLQEEITNGKPRVIVPVGDIALNAILPNDNLGIQTSRGYVFEHPSGALVVPIVHPSFVARGNREYWAITVYDLKKVRAAIEGTLLPPPSEHFNLFPSIGDVRDICQYILRNQLKVSFDIETIGWRHKLNMMCCGLAWSPNDALCVPFLKRGGHTYWSDPLHEVEAFYWLNEIFKSSCLKVGQNIFTFDIPVLMDLGFEFQEFTCRDTLVRHHSIALELPHSLSFLTSVYTRIPHYKLDVKKAGGMLWAPDAIMRRYNCLDCIATYQVDDHLTKEMLEYGILEDGAIA